MFHTFFYHSSEIEYKNILDNCMLFLHRCWNAESASSFHLPLWNVQSPRVSEFFFSSDLYRFSPTGLMPPHPGLSPHAHALASHALVSSAPKTDHSTLDHNHRFVLTDITATPGPFSGNPTASHASFNKSSVPFFFQPLFPRATLTLRQSQQRRRRNHYLRVIEEMSCNEESRCTRVWIDSHLDESNFRWIC